MIKGLVRLFRQMAGKLREDVSPSQVIRPIQLIANAFEKRPKFLPLLKSKAAFPARALDVHVFFG